MKQIIENDHKTSISEKERYELAIELGNNLQELVDQGKTQWQQIDKNEWKQFSSGRSLVNYLFKEHGVFYKDSFFGRSASFFEANLHSHKLEQYPQRIPMSVLIHAKEAREAGLGNLWILDPDLKAIKVDPFLVAAVGSFNNLYIDEPCTLICSWLDKSK